MKIVQINCVYADGSTGKLTKSLHDYLLREGHESHVLYGRGRTHHEPGIHRVCSERYGQLNAVRSWITGLMYGGCFLSTRRIINFLKKTKPDVVHLQCINGYFVNIYRLITWLKENHVRTVLTLHAEFMFTGNCGHSYECDYWKTGCHDCPQLKHATKSLYFNRTHESWCKFRKAFEDFKELDVVSVSPWLMERAKQSPILAKANHRVILNGIDTSIFKPCKPHPIIEKLKSEDKKVILHVTPGFNLAPGHPKGGEYVVDLAYRLQNEKSAWKIVVAGPVTQDNFIPENILTIGRITNQEELASLYSGADVTLLTSKRETFSMVTAESLCCGTPVIGFKAGAPEMIAIPNFSTFVEHGDLSSLILPLKNHIALEKLRIATESIALYSSMNMCKNYMNVYTT